MFSAKEEGYCLIFPADGKIQVICDTKKDVIMQMARIAAKSPQTCLIHIKSPRDVLPLCDTGENIAKLLTLR